MPLPAPAPAVFKIEIEGQADHDFEEARVVRDMPPGLENHLSADEWNQFCTKVDEALQTYSTSRTQALFLNCILYGLFSLLFISGAVHLVSREAAQDRSDCNGQTRSSTSGKSCGSSDAQADEFMAPAMIMLIPLFVLITVIVVRWSLQSAQDDSLNNVRRVCREFSSTKPNMVVDFTPRYFCRDGKQSDRYFTSSSTKRIPKTESQPTWYIEFWFSTQDTIISLQSFNDEVSSLHDVPSYQPPTLSSCSSKKSDVEQPLSQTFSGLSLQAVWSSKTEETDVESHVGTPNKGIASPVIHILH